MGPNDDARRLGHPSPALAFICLHWPATALHWLVLAFVGLCWHSLGLRLASLTRWPVMGVVGLHSLTVSNYMNNVSII
jgi:hypothetical protein